MKVFAIPTAAGDSPAFDDPRRRRNPRTPPDETKDTGSPTSVTGLLVTAAAPAVTFLKMGNISVLDIKNSVAPGQISVTSAIGLHHNGVAQVAPFQGKETDSNAKEESFTIFFAALGVSMEKTHLFRNGFEKIMVMQNTDLLLDLAYVPTIECILPANAKKNTNPFNETTKKNVDLFDPKKNKNIIYVSSMSMKILASVNATVSAPALATVMPSRLPTSAVRFTVNAFATGPVVVVEDGCPHPLVGDARSADVRLTVTVPSRGGPGSGGGAVVPAVRGAGPGALRGGSGSAPFAPEAWLAPAVGHGRPPLPVEAARSSGVRTAAAVPGRGGPVAGGAGGGAAGPAARGAALRGAGPAFRHGAGTSTVHTGHPPSGGTVHGRAPAARSVRAPSPVPAVRPTAVKEYGISKWIRGLLSLSTLYLLVVNLIGGPGTVSLMRCSGVSAASIYDLSQGSNTQEVVEILEEENPMQENADQKSTKNGHASPDIDLLIGKAGIKVKNLMRSSPGNLRGDSANIQESFEDAVASISDAMDTSKIYQEILLLIPSQVRSGHIKEAVATTTKLLKGLESHARIAKGHGDHAHSNFGLQAPLSRVDLQPSEISDDALVQMEGVLGSRLVDTKSLQLLDEISKGTELVHDALSDIHLSLTHGNLGSHTAGGRVNNFHFENSDPGHLKSNRYGDNGIASSLSLKAMSRRMIKDNTDRNHHHTKKHLSEEGTRRHLQRVDGIPECKPRCEVDNTLCNCNRLRGCVGKMAPNDFAMMVLDGFVDTDRGGENYGNFTRQDLNLHDAAGLLPTKINRIEVLQTETGPDCNDLLEELTTLCDPEQPTCTGPNEQSYQLTIDQVCDRVDNPTKLLVSAIADKLDGIKKMSNPFVDDRVDTPIEKWYAGHTIVQDTLVQDEVLYQHLWRGHCREHGDVFDSDIADLLVKTLTQDDLDFNEDIENNADLCAAACAKTSGCLSFELPFSKIHYWWHNNYRCNLFFMPCKTMYDDADAESSLRYWSSYQMGCFDEKCKNEWLDESHVHNVRKIRVQHNNKGDLPMHIVRVYTDDTTRFQELGMAAYQSADNGFEFIVASNCLVDDISMCYPGFGVSEKEGSWWELNLGQDTAVYKVEIVQSTTLTQDASIYLVDSNDIILATAQIGEYRDPANVYRADSEFTRNKCIAQCQIDMKLKLDGIQETWKNNQPSEDHCNAVVSYKVCSDFALTFDKFYQLRDSSAYPDENPMSRSGNAVTHGSAHSILSQVKFPVSYIFHESSQGIQQYQSGEYNFPSPSPWGLSLDSSSGWLNGPLHWLGVYDGGVETCYLAIMQDPLCIKDIFGYVSGDKRCSCRKQGVATTEYFPGSKEYSVETFPGTTSGKRVIGTWTFKPSLSLPSPYTYTYFDVETTVGCPKSLSDGGALRAMENCDKSMALLLGGSTSIGTLRGMVDKLLDKKSKWVLGASGESCDEVCVAQEAACTAESTEKQTGLNTRDEAVAAYQEAGFTCTAPHPRDLFGSPYAWGSGTSDCGMWGHYNGETTTSSCGDSPNGKRRLCWCDTGLGLTDYMNYMPGECCLDTALNSAFFGNNYDTGMACQQRGPWHLGISKEACENARGRWFRTPCVTLKACIDNRPANGTDTFSLSFDNFAEEIQINDPAQTSQCQVAREALGYEPDHPDDIEICKRVKEYQCDPLYDGIDEKKARITEPPKYQPVTYNPIEYEPDPKLSFDDLPERISPSMTELTGKEGLNDLQREWITKEKNYEKFAQIKDVAMDLFEQICANIEKSETSAAVDIITPFGLKRMPVLATIVCNNIALILKYFYVVALPIVQHNYIEARRAYELETLSPAKMYYTWIHAENTAIHLKDFDQWSVKALGTINKNVHDQHKEIRSHLQRRHVMMENHINTLSTKYTNHLGDYAEAVAGMIYGHHRMIFERAGGIVANLTPNTALPDEEYDKGTYFFIVWWPYDEVLSISSCTDRTVVLREKDATDDKQKWSKERVADNNFYIVPLGCPIEFEGAALAWQNADSSCEDATSEPLQVITRSEFSDEPTTQQWTINDDTDERIPIRSVKCPNRVVKVWINGGVDHAPFMSKDRTGQSTPDYQTGFKFVPDQIQSSPDMHSGLHKLKLPPKLEVQWPKGHSSLSEVISNEVVDYVEEVGTTVLAALGADVTTTRKRIVGTSERHFEMDVKWPNGGQHILDEVKNHHLQALGQVENKVGELAEQIRDIKDMMKALLEKSQ